MQFGAFLGYVTFGVIAARAGRPVQHHAAGIVAAGAD